MPLIPVLGRSQTTIRSAGGNRFTPAGKAKGKANGSILSFFKKAETPLGHDPVAKDEQTSLFFEESDTRGEHVSHTQMPTPPRENVDVSPDKSTLRYNEDLRAVKRRRTSEHNTSTTVDDVAEAGDEQRSDSLDGATTRRLPTDSGHSTHNGDHSPQKDGDSLVDISTEEHLNATASKSNPGNGPFVEDPESDDDMIRHWTRSAFEDPKPLEEVLSDEASPLAIMKCESSKNSAGNVPSLYREGTSIVGGDGFEGMEEFIDDEFPEDGEEYMERLWMKEQEGLELGLEDDSMGDSPKEEPNDTADLGSTLHGDDATSSCPICSESLQGITPEVGCSEDFYKST